MKTFVLFYLKTLLLSIFAAFTLGMPVMFEVIPVTSDRAILSSQSPLTRNDSMVSKSATIEDKRTTYFFKVIQSYSQSVLRYENVTLQNKARVLVPLDRLNIEATQKMRTLQRITNTRSTRSNRQCLESEYRFEDFVLKELMLWFKRDFFKWVGTPTCPNCHSNDSSLLRTDFSSDPWITETEVYMCNSCGIEHQFHRYRDPEPLLTTRRGRCGEWADVFTLLCRTLGYDARLAYDHTDHVWTEVWSVGCNKWLHADHGDDGFDNPLLYELGWKKKLNYVIAFSKDEVRDVTWRYTRDRNAVMNRRTICSEANLTSLIDRLNEELQHAPGYSEERRKYVTEKFSRELAGMMSLHSEAGKLDDENDNMYRGIRGRTARSLAWRLPRGATMTVPRP